MSYVALYRKYRPRNFDDVVGQDAIVRTLKNAINQNKIAHAYLFCGPRGTGKTSVAKIFAMSVNCTSENKPCMTCESCSTFLEGDSPDVIEIDAASNNGVDEVRDLIDKVKYSPQISKYKVYIIDEVHMMSVSAFNALLKTIEEPPKHVIFILATTDPHKVIPTIISRCQRYDFNSVSLETMSLRLLHVMDKEKITYEDGVVDRISLLSEGGMRDALSILDQVIAYSGNSIRLEDIDTVYGTVNGTELCSYLELLMNEDTAELFSFFQQIKVRGTDIKRLCQDLIHLLKDILFYSYTKDLKNIQFLDIAQVSRILDSVNKSILIQCSDLLIESNEKMKSTSDVNTYFELVSLKLMQVMRNEHELVVNDSNLNIQISQVAPEELINKQEDNVSRETLKDNIQKEVIVPRETITKDEKEITNVPRETLEDNNQADNYFSELVEQPIRDDKVLISQEDVHKEVTENINVNQVSEINTEFLLSLLNGANKEYKAEVTEKYKRNPNYSNDFNWIKQANILRDIEIVAAGENYIILKTRNKNHAEIIHDKKDERSFQLFMKELFGRYMHIYALSSNEVVELVNEFKNRMTSNTLPEVVQLETIVLEDTKEELDETTEKVIQLFGKDNIIMEE